MILDLPYQRAGAEFLANRRHAYLADEMRLGKSKQAIDAADRIQAERILVIGPAIGRWNWLREFDKHSVFGREFQVVEQRDAEIERRKSVSISYDLAREPKIQAQLANRYFDVLIADEAHYLKSPLADRTKAILGKDGVVHCCARFWGLSGTPDPNGDPGELWTVLRTLYPKALTHDGKIDTYDQHMDRYTVRKRVNRSGHDILKVVSVKNIPALKERMEPFLLRRTKAQVRPELPAMRFGEIILPVENPIARWVRSGPFTEEMTEWHELGLAKVKPLAETIAQDLLFGADKIVVFCWHIDVIIELMRRLQGKSVKAVMLYGSTQPKHKERALHDFQHDPSVQVFVGQIKACGTNISLAAADDVIFAEQSWVPGDNAQALMRVEDPSKLHPCLTRFAIAHGTLDEPLTASLRRKENWTKELLGD